MDIATFGAGCFWCIEAILLNVPGIASIDVGYTGGHIENPNYKMICEGNTGHAEVAQIKFDNQQLTYEELLLIFCLISPIAFSTRSIPLQISSICFSSRLHALNCLQFSSPKKLRSL